MKLKDKFLGLGKTYEELRREAFRIIEEVKLKVQSMTDAQIVQSLRENKDFYWKHDLSTIRELARRYSIGTSDLDAIFRKYIEIEQDLLKNKIYFEQLGLNGITFGPKSMSASGEKESRISFNFDIDNQKIDIYIYPENEDNWTEDFEKFAEKLKNKITNLMES